MIKPQDKELQEFTSIGVHFLEQKTLAEIKKPGEKWMSVRVSLAVLQKDVKAPQFSYSLVTKRGCAIIASDWKFEYNQRIEQDELSFIASMRMPDDIDMPEIEYYQAMTFMDLCFYAGNEALPEGHKVDTFTQLYPGSKLTDLGWIYPSRFVDTLIDMLGKLNDVALAGQLQESILYSTD